MIEEDIIAAGAQIIWVLETTSSNRPANATQCRDAFNSYGSDKGLCVGDAQTMPNAGAFQDSPFARGRGIEMIVRRSDMKIVFEASHGSPSGNDNLSAAELLQEVRRVTGR